MPNDRRNDTRKPRPGAVGGGVRRKAGQRTGAISGGERQQAGQQPDRQGSGKDAAAGRAGQRRDRQGQPDEQRHTRDGRQDGQRYVRGGRQEPIRKEKPLLPWQEPAVDRPRPSGDKSYTVEQSGELLTYLLEIVTNRGRNAVKSMLARGQIEVNGRAVTAYNYALQPGQTVTVRKEAAAETVPLAGMSILHEDEEVIVIQKDAGLLSISAGAKAVENEITAYRQLTAHVRQGNAKGRVFVVHRLDRDTSGVMMFAKSEDVQQQLQNAWQDVVKERSYVALVEGMVRKPEGTITSWLKETKTLLVYSSQHENDGQYAVTHYKTLKTSRDFSLLEVQLETGRKNQIRVHMSDIGHPIVGDKKYGSRSRAIGRLGLHARVLSFLHPRTGELMRFETDIPKALQRPFQTTI